MISLDILLSFSGLFTGLLIGLFVLGQKKFDEQALIRKAEKTLSESEKESISLIAKARDHAVTRKKQFEIEEKEFAVQLKKLEQIFIIKSGSQEKKETKIKELQKSLDQEERLVQNWREQTGSLQKNLWDRLLQITGFSPTQVREQLLKQYEETFQQDSEMYLQRAMEWAQESALREGRNILGEAIYRFTDITSVEHEEKNIVVPRDEMKGRVVGRGGRLIAFFEELFGVDVVFNDEPDFIIVSCFNLVQREIARVALEKLIREKTLNEEIIRYVKTWAEGEVDKMLCQEGEKALKILQVPGMPPDFAKLVGRLKFRTSYGQNIMRHCFEVGYLARLIANEIGADEHIAWLGGFFHDIGKAIDQEVGGSHDVLSKEILEKYGFSWEITHAAWTHHNAIPQETIEARIVQAADAISASRPGARAESVERYLAKIHELQETGLSFEGVRKAYAINAGRELRLLVDPDKIDDITTNTLASQVAARVQEKGGYPGKIKIVAIRTTKVTEYAR